VPDAKNHAIFLYDTWFTLRPNDLLRFDISSSRKAFDNYKSLVLGINATSAGVSADLTPNERTKLSARSTRWWYSDENRMRLLQAEAGYRVINSPQTTIGLRYTNFIFKYQLDNGYFNPLDFQAADIKLHSWAFFGKWLYEVEGSYGREWERSNNSQKPMGSLTVKLGRVMDKRLYLETSFQHFNSRIVTDIGFSRTTFGLRGTYNW
jgi:hypothetical protein